MNFSPQKIGFLSLGCPRNLVDTEVMLGFVKEAGFTLTDDIYKSEVVVINTCGFIKEAKEESIEAILKVAELKKEGNLKSLIVAGCLSQGYKEELKKELPEVDAFLGTGELKSIVDIIKALPINGSNIKIKSSDFLYDHRSPRVLLTPEHYAYVKISEGCRNNCSYCIIKNLRGNFRSRLLSSILNEVKTLSKKKPPREIILIGQDTTLYGVDLYKKPRIYELLNKICSLSIIKWIRLLYTHPAHFDDSLIDVIRDKPSICKYIDLPIQHINDEILKRMNRKISKRDIIRLIERLRKNIPNVAIRTSLIVGFPGETEKEFRELLDFVRQVEFERLGVFIYSREEKTPAFNFKCQVPEGIKRERFDLIMKTQQEIAKQKNTKFLGRILDILIDEKDENDTSLFIGRTEFDAPEVDGVVYVSVKRKAQSEKLKVGEFTKVKIIDTLEYDLVGILV
ncbi:MAG: 30S ribosomal protein S12 methylthiotransferase RimO [Candidatus Omnitrophica bacterium]|nr:30S ribosomal protein S12 methylthiotransferase RimO [Candidatus Omnitrophota bacterium]